MEAAASCASKAAASRGSRATGTRGPTSNRACRPLSATVSAAVNFQSGMCDCTISKPGAIHSTQASRSSSEGRAGGVAFRPKTHSGSMRGWQVPASATSPSPSQNESVVFQTVPQMGA